MVVIGEYVSSRERLEYAIYDDCEDPDLNPQAGLEISAEERLSASHPMTVSAMRVTRSDKGDLRVGDLIDVVQYGGMMDGTLYLEDESVFLEDVLNGKQILISAFFVASSHEYAPINKDAGLFVVDTGSLEPLRSESMAVTSPFSASLHQVEEAVSRDVALGEAGLMAEKPEKKCLYFGRLIASD
ncbi:MAG: hypothetical protein FWG16_02205 [Micrococcales bacterium]|nr:hypothetical protein [Micrococcales bacterium]